MFMFMFICVVSLLLFFFLSSWRREEKRRKRSDFHHFSPLVLLAVSFHRSTAKRHPFLFPFLFLFLTYTHTTMRFSFLVVLVAALLAASVVSAATCNQQCANNNDCTTAACSRCTFGTCQSGLPCGAACSVDTDCYGLGSCPLCQNRFCGGSPVSTASPTPLPAPSASPTPSPSPLPPAPGPAQPSTVKVCLGKPKQDIYDSQCGPANPIIVEGNWTALDCATLAISQTYQQYDLGCLTQDGLSVGTRGKPPSNDCGWAQGGNLVPAKNQTKICSLIYSTESCNNIYSTATVGDGWSGVECGLLSKRLFSIISNSGYYDGYQLGCTFDFYTGSFSHGDQSGSIPSNDCGWAHPPQLLQNTRYNSTKLCGAVYFGSSEVSVLNVLDTWSGYDCHSYATSIGATNFFLGCIFYDNFSLANTGGFTPSPNCGW